MADAHAALRAGTRVEHERLDALMAGFDLSVAASYRRFLRVHAAALPVIEHALDRAGFAERLPDWPERRRSALLAADLAVLGATMPPPRPFALTNGIAGLWGAAYVAEGSRLGGALLARRVGAGLPRSYLGTAQPPGRWRGFLAALDSALGGAQDIADAVAAARAVFALFEAAAAGETELI